MKLDASQSGIRRGLKGLRPKVALVLGFCLIACALAVTLPGSAAGPVPTVTAPPNCTVPGLQVVQDVAGDQTGAPAANQALDARAVSIAEQYPATNSGKMIVTMKVQALDPANLPPNATWQANFDVRFPDNTTTTYFVTAATNSLNNPTGISYNFGFHDTATDFDTTVETAESGSLDAQTATLTVAVLLSHIKQPVAGTGQSTLDGPVADLSAGKSITNVNFNTSLLVGVAGNGISETIDSTGNGTYTFVGVSACNGDPTPTPTPTPSPTPSATPTPTPGGGGSSAAIPRYFNYTTPTGIADDAGEPSIGVNWKSERVFSNSNGPVPNGGTVTYFGGFLPYMLKVTFDDAASPANVTWDQAPVTLPSAPRVFGDPILFTDHETGRTFVSQLLGLTPLGSTTEFTDNDGASFTPSEGSGLPSNVDHQTFGGGPFAAPLTGGTPVYKNAVYYCSQSVADAGCSLSADGGMTFGPAVPIYTISDCAGLHGHVKVSPKDGTVYVPEKACGGSLPYHAGGTQALIVSENNGATWNIRTLPGTTTLGDDDPSVGVASDGTVYFGYQSGDGHARIAVSHDKGLTWINNTDVGAQLGVQN
ncbi:MAG TPA: sialidase family protein, partial [Pyrinomonadaceae bacterium]